MCQCFFSFLLKILDKQCSSSTIKVYAAAIADFHAPIAGRSVGRDRAVTNGGPKRAPVWTIAILEPQSILVENHWRRSSETCGPFPSTLFAWNSGPTTPRSSGKQGWVMYLRCSPRRSEPRLWRFPRFPPPPTGSQGYLLCPIRALRIFIERSASYRKSEQLFVGFGNHAKGGPVTKQIISRWFVDAITPPRGCSAPSESEPIPPEALPRLGHGPAGCPFQTN